MNAIIENLKSNIKVVPSPKTEQLEEVNMDIIRYANCWEDAELLLEGLGDQKGNSILSIASGGDNSLSLLSLNPKKVVAIDVNETQLFVLELKREAIRKLSHEAFLEFIGFRESDNRFETYISIRPQLSKGAQKYWDSQIELLEGGLVHGGKFEKYLMSFCKRVLPFIHSRKKVEKLLAPKSEKEQADFVAKKWNTLRWRMLFKIFFSKFILGRFGRDPEFLKEVDINVGEYLLQKANVYLSTQACQNNWMLKYIMEGEFGTQLPHYAQEENFETIKSNLDKLHLQKGLAEDAIQKHGKFDAFNLSNIFEYMDPSTFKLVGTQLIEGSKPGARMAYWNLMVPRKLSQIFFSLENREKTSALADRGFFYRAFHVDQALK